MCLTKFASPQPPSPLQPKASLENSNSGEYLERLRTTILQRLSRLQAAPGVAFHERAPDAMQLEDLEVGVLGVLS